jgi:hypothetical protein
MVKYYRQEFLGNVIFYKVVFNPVKRAYFKHELTTGWVETFFTLEGDKLTTEQVEECISRDGCYLTEVTEEEVATYFMLWELEK